MKKNKNIIVRIATPLFLPASPLFFLIESWISRFPKICQYCPSSRQYQTSRSIGFRMPIRLTLQGPLYSAYPPVLQAKTHSSDGHNILDSHPTEGWLTGQNEKDDLKQTPEITLLSFRLMRYKKKTKKSIKKKQKFFVQKLFYLFDPLRIYCMINCI